MTSSRAFLFTVLLCALIVPATAGATYAGDKPLTDAYYGEINGNFLYTLGNSSYSGSLDPGAVYNVTFDVHLPGDAKICYQRLYVYWTWSRVGQKAIYPNLTLAIPGIDSSAINMTHRYVDNKGFVSSNDYFSGMDVYEVPGLSPDCKVFLRQDGGEGSSVVLHGIGQLIVYESPGEPSRMIWAKEGCDMLFSSYGISPEMAASTVEFDGAVPITDISRAQLYIVAPSGGYSRNNFQYKNALLVNHIPEEQMPALLTTVMSILFPNFKGKEWSDAFDYDDVSQIGIDDRDVRPYLRSDGNKVEVRDQGDYFQLTNMVMSIELRS